MSITQSDLEKARVGDQFLLADGTRIGIRSIVLRGKDTRDPYYDIEHDEPPHFIFWHLQRGLFIDLSGKARSKLNHPDTRIVPRTT
ncbi:MAG: hypothetical protein V1853_05490 [bacterium]